MGLFVEFDIYNNRWKYLLIILDVLSKCFTFILLACDSEIQ